MGMRMIDADALEKVFEKIPEEKLCNGCFDAVVNAIAYAPTVTPEPGWISVKVRLPDKGQIVIVSDGKHTWDVGQYKVLCYTPGRTEDNPRRDYWEWKKNTVKTVWWWMPKENALPEPPKEEA